ncbi:hypothetical protein D9M70_144720 [compost metagenome]
MQEFVLGVLAQASRSGQLQPNTNWAPGECGRKRAGEALREEELDVGSNRPAARLAIAADCVQFRAR